MKMLRFIFMPVVVGVVGSSACQIQKVVESEFNGEQFIHFLTENHYLDGTRDIEEEKDREYVKKVLEDKKASDLIDNLYTGSFAPNVALVAAQVGLFDTAAEVLGEVYEDGEPDWLFDMIESEGKDINKESIQEALKTLYPSN